jgi:beta-glucuronidase
MYQSMLYPCINACRTYRTLDGMWKMQFDPEGKGRAEGWQNGLPEPFSMPVPSSFSDLFTEKEKRDYCGDFWYETKFYLEVDDGRRVILRFGSITHRADIWINGIHAAYHEGGLHRLSSTSANMSLLAQETALLSVPTMN